MSKNFFRTSKINSGQYVSGLLCVLFFLLPGSKVSKVSLPTQQLTLIQEAPTPVRRTTELAKLNLEDHNLAFIGARAFFVLDVDSGAILAAKNENQVFYPASTTKMMTALVAKETYSLEQTLTVPANIENEGNGMGLVSGEVIRVDNLLYGLLIPSGNDAARTLAYHYPGGVDAFVARMNLKAQQLHLEHTHFANPAGFDDNNQSSTAKDLSLLAQELLKDDLLRQIVSLSKKTVTDESGEIVHDLQTTNHLLGVVDGVTGVKTGTTQLAGEVLITAVEREGHTILIALLASKDRFSETTQIIDWVFKNYQWI